MIKKKHTNLEDKELLELFYKDGNNEWLGVLLQRYTLLLLGVCMKYLKNEEEAKDSVQQIFLKVINELHKYKVSYFKSLLYMVTKNHCLMQLRNKGKYTVSISEDILAAREDLPEIKTAVEKENVLNNMERALAQLNPEQQTCISLFYLDKKTYQQIAEETGYPVMQIKSNIQNGKRNLKIQMQRMQPDE